MSAVFNNIKPKYYIIKDIIGCGYDKGHLYSLWNL